jgi:hypothetical protein
MPLPKAAFAEPLPQPRSVLVEATTTEIRVPAAKPPAAAMPAAAMFATTMAMRLGMRARRCRHGQQPRQHNTGQAVELPAHTPNRPLHPPVPSTSRWLSAPIKARIRRRKSSMREARYRAPLGNAAAQSHMFRCK